MCKWGKKKLSQLMQIQSACIDDGSLSQLKARIKTHTSDTKDSPHD